MHTRSEIVGWSPGKPVEPAGGLETGGVVALAVGGGNVHKGGRRRCAAHCAMPCSRAACFPLLLALLCGSAAAASDYEVPEPYIQALRPRGLRISIPDDEGIELFAVHANINKDLPDLAAGEISHDVLRLRDNRWVFEDLNISVRPGDLINYWLYVKRNGLGFRKDAGSFAVRELVPRNTPATPPVSQCCSQPCQSEGAVVGSLSQKLQEQRLRHQQELHEQRVRHLEELHKERLQKLRQGCHAGAAAAADSKDDPQDVSAFRRIASDQ